MCVHVCMCLYTYLFTRIDSITKKQKQKTFIDYAYYNMNFWMPYESLTIKD